MRLKRRKREPRREGYRYRDEGRRENNYESGLANPTYIEKRQVVMRRWRIQDQGTGDVAKVIARGALTVAGLVRGGNIDGPSTENGLPLGMTREDTGGGLPRQRA